MEILFEIVLSIIFEGSIEGIKNKTIPMWLRVICGIIVFLLIIFVMGIITILAIIIWDKYYHIPSLLLLLINFILIINIVKTIKNAKE